MARIFENGKEILNDVSQGTTSRLYTALRSALATLTNRMEAA